MMFTDEQIKIQQRERYLSCWSWNEDFDRDGYIFVKNFLNLEHVVLPENPTPGIKEYFGNINLCEHRDEDQVFGSSSRIKYPPYKKLYYEAKEKVENIL